MKNVLIFMSSNLCWHSFKFPIPLYKIVTLFSPPQTAPHALIAAQYFTALTIFFAKSQIAGYFDISCTHKNLRLSKQMTFQFKHSFISWILHFLYFIYISINFGFLAEIQSNKLFYHKYLSTYTYIICSIKIILYLNGQLS